jgi:Protein of unknown function (DUF2505)
MSRPIDYRCSYPSEVGRTFAALADPDYLCARLAEVGGPDAELLEHTRDGDDVRYRLRFALERDVLPALVQSLVGGRLLIERTESLHPDGDGYGGDVRVAVPGAPVSATGGMTLRPAAGGSEFALHADVSVRVPLIGGRIEASVGDQVRQLLTSESEFTRKWLAGDVR